MNQEIEYFKKTLQIYDLYMHARNVIDLISHVINDTSIDLVQTVEQIENILSVYHDNLADDDE